MRVSFLVVLLSTSVSLLGPFSCPLFADEAPPNIVFLLADDLGYGDVGCFGREDIRTPAIDRLAAEGVRLTSHYANGPECTPTRTAFMTGLYQHRVGGLECAIGIGDIGRYDEALALSERGELGLPARVPTLPRLLKDAGYATCLSGKWHLGYGNQFSPQVHGFDEALECVGGGMDYFHYVDNLGAYNLRLNGEYVPRTGYFTDLVTNHALEFIETHQEQPFFLYVAYTTPHSPYQGPEDYTPEPTDSGHWRQGHAEPRVYINMIEHMDRSIGMIAERLDKLRLSSRTLIIFAGDNGGTKSSRNAPLSGYKGSTLEGGIRVPAAVRWPGQLAPGTECDVPCMTFDLSRSIVAAAGVDPDAYTQFDGVDILKHLAEGTQPEDRMLFWRRPRGTTITMAARKGNMKYVARRQAEQIEESLYDLAADIAESRDLKQERPETFQELRRAYQAWEQRVRDGVHERTVGAAR